MLLLGLFLYAGAWVGHIAVFSFSLNRWHALPFPRPILKALKLGHGAAVVGGPVLFWLGFGLDLTRALDPGSLHDWRLALAGYLVFCWLLCFLVVPGRSAWRHATRKPAVLQSNHTHTLDVAAELGYRPVGDGKHARLARWPGNEIYQVDFSERTLTLPRLPAAWDGLTILHVSDLHFCGTPDRDFFRTVLDRCRDWDPDLLALTGDFVDSEHHYRWIVPLLGRLRWRLGAYAVLGNHDAWRGPETVRRRLRRLGIHVLGNSWHLREVRGLPLVVVGHEGPWFSPEPDLTECPGGTFRLCLSHTPDNIHWARARGIDLMLAGHNHGGQIRFPLIGSVLVPSRYGTRYDGGTFHEPPTVLHVSRGLSGQHPLRYNCRPEVTQLVLRRPSSCEESGDAV